MAYEDTSVDSFEESVQDDAAQAPEQEPQESNTLSDLMEEMPEDGQKPSQDGKESGKELSGGIKGRLLASEKKGYERGRSEAEAAWQKEREGYEARISALQELELKEEAKKLAAEEGISEAIATRLLRAERGLAPKQEPAPAQQPRDERGRFVEDTARKENDAYAQKLLGQAEAVKRLTGIDVMDAFNSDDDIRRRIASREIDFYDLAEELKEPSRRVPPVVKASTGDTTRHRGIASLSDEQFDELDRRLEGGARYDMRR